MYAIVKKGNGEYYKSTVFGLENAGGIHERFFLVFDEKKEKLIKKVVYPADSKYLDPQVIIVDCDNSGWKKIENGYGCLDILAEIDFSQEEFCVPDDILAECKRIDGEFVYDEYPVIKEEKDILNFLWATGCMHDAFVKGYERTEEGIYVLFGGVWGALVEMWFLGDARTSIDKWTEPQYNFCYWEEAGVAIDGDYVYIMEGSVQVPDAEDEDYLWFGAKTVRYHIIPR